MAKSARAMERERGRMINGNPRFGHKLTCDICGENFVFETFDDAFDYKKENGWKSGKYKGKWQDICPECQEG